MAEHPEVMISFCAHVSNMVSQSKELQKTYQEFGEQQYNAEGGLTPSLWRESQNKYGKPMSDPDLDLFIELFDNESRNIQLLEMYQNRICPYFQMRIDKV